MTTTLELPKRVIPEPYRETPQHHLADGSLPPTLGPVAVRWMEAMLVHGEGDLLGKPYRVPGWLRRALYRLFEYDPVSFEYMVREALIVGPKGFAKTEGIAGVGLFLLAGPSLPTPDGPVMRSSPNIPVAAASWEQAGRLFKDAAVNMATGTADSPSPLGSFVECFETEIQLRGMSGRLFRVAAVAGTNDGGLPTAALCDELHEWEGRRERVHLILTQGLDSKRSHGIALNITTPDDADPESLLGRKIGYAERVASGEVHDPGFYYLRYAAPDGCKLDTEEQVVAAVEAAHPAEWIAPGKIARKLLVDRIPVHEFRRYWLGQFVPREGAWLPGGAWDEVEVVEGWPEPDTKVVLGFDGSYKGDCTALVGCTVPDVGLPHLFVVGLWERPPDAPDNWRVPRGQVKAEVARAMKRWNVVELAADPPGWHTELEEFEDAYGEIVVLFETNQRKRMAAAVDRFYQAVVEQSFTNDGDPRMARHLRNCRTKETPQGVMITKESAASPRKIDAAVAAVVAFERAWVHLLAEPEEQQGFFAAWA